LFAYGLRLLATSAAKADEDDGSVSGGPVVVGRKGKMKGEN